METPESQAENTPSADTELRAGLERGDPKIEEGYFDNNIDQVTAGPSDGEKFEMQVFSAFQKAPVERIIPAYKAAASAQKCGVSLR